MDFYGIESGFPLDKEAHVLAILCDKNIIILSFNARETLIEWEIRIRNHLGEGESDAWIVFVLRAYTFKLCFIILFFNKIR